MTQCEAANGRLREELAAAMTAAVRARVEVCLSGVKRTLS
jgi:hypothetical protein